MTDTPNAVTPRQIAAASIADEIARVRERIAAHDAEFPPGPDLFHSQIRVFLEQVAFELRRAAVHLELHDASDDE